MSAVSTRDTLIGPEALAAVNNLRFELIVEAADLAVSYARSVAEAAWRGDRRLLGVHLRQLRAAAITAIGAYKELSAEPGGKAEKAA